MSLSGAGIPRLQHQSHFAELQTLSALLAACWSIEALVMTDHLCRAVLHCACKSSRRYLDALKPEIFCTPIAQLT
jgi:hypothetical protein